MFSLLGRARVPRRVARQFPIPRCRGRAKMISGNARHGATAKSWIITNGTTRRSMRITEDDANGAEDDGDGIPHEHDDREMVPNEVHDCDLVSVRLGCGVRHRLSGDVRRTEQEDDASCGDGQHRDEDRNEAIEQEALDDLSPGQAVRLGRMKHHPVARAIPPSAASRPLLKDGRPLKAASPHVIGEPGRCWHRFPGFRLVVSPTWAEHHPAPPRRSAYFR